MANDKRILQDTSVKSRYTLDAKVSEKGAVSIYGIRRFPIVLYREELEAILGKADSLKAFMNANASQLSTKSTNGERAPTEGRTRL